MTSTEPPGNFFATTRWSMVLRAGRSDTTRAQAALAELCGTYWYPLYAYARRRGCSPQDAEDATQEILVKVLTRLSSFEGRSSFRTWLYRVAFNHLLNMKRGREELKVMRRICW